MALHGLLHLQTSSHGTGINDSFAQVVSNAVTVQSDLLPIPTIKGGSLCIKINQQQYELALVESQQNYMADWSSIREIRLLSQRKSRIICQNFGKQLIHGI